jgi:hypothetical protein
LHWESRLCRLRPEIHVIIYSVTLITGYTTSGKHLQQPSCFIANSAEAEEKEMTFLDLIMKRKTCTEKVQNQFLIPKLSLAKSVKKEL